MSKLEVDTIAPQSGTTVTVGESGDTVTIPTGVTLDASNATTTLPANVVTTDGTQTLTNKSIAATQLTGTITPSDGTVTNAKVNASAAIDYSKLNLTGNIALADLSATGTKDATTFLRGDNTFAEAGGGLVLQVVSARTGTQVTSNTATYIDTGLTASITPSSTSSKILVMVQQSFAKNSGDTSGNFRVYRDSTEIGGTIPFREVGKNDSSAFNVVGTGFSCSILDTPASTSSLTYKTQFNNRNGVGTVSVQYDSGNSYITLMEIAG